MSAAKDAPASNRQPTNAIHERLILQRAWHGLGTNAIGREPDPALTGEAEFGRVAEMKEEDQNKSIAEACGNAYHKPTEGEIKSGSYYQYEPSFTRDLNAIHSAIISQQWDSVKRKAFLIYLAKNRGDFSVVNATAAQRAEAFLRTIGKWQEDK